MAITLRLHRKGNRNRSFYRVVAADPRKATSGRIVESLGWYDPNRGGVNFKLKIDRIDYWLGNGAIVTPTVKNLVSQARLLPPEPEPVAEETPAEPEASAPDTEDTPVADAPAEAEAPAEPEAPPADAGTE